MKPLLGKNPQYQKENENKIFFLDFHKIYLKIDSFLLQSTFRRCYEQNKTLKR